MWRGLFQEFLVDILPSHLLKSPVARTQASNLQNQVPFCMNRSGKKSFSKTSNIVKSFRNLLKEGQPWTKVFRRNHLNKMNRMMIMTMKTTLGDLYDETPAFLSATKIEPKCHGTLSSSSLLYIML